MVKTSAPVTLDSAAVTYADGVQVAPAILTQGSRVQWSKRVPAVGATLDPASGWYNVFLHLRVYPDALPLHTDGVVLTYHDTGGPQTVTWVDHLSFRTSC